MTWPFRTTFLQVPYGAVMHNLFKVATGSNQEKADKPYLLIDRAMLGPLLTEPASSSKSRSSRMRSGGGHGRCGAKSERHVDDREAQ